MSKYSTAKKGSGSLHPIAVKVWNQVGIDLIGAYLRHLMGTTDCFSKWAEAAPPDTTAAGVARFLYSISPDH